MRRIIPRAAAAVAVTIALAGASVSGATPVPPASGVPSLGQYVANAADFVSAANWETAQELTIELSEYAFTPNDITLEAGQPYVLTVVNKGTLEHEFVAEDFFRSVATRKAETTESEVKVPFFTEIEVFAGKSAELFLIPLIPGEYELLCEIKGHREAGMFGTITVTGQTPTSPALQLADVAAGPWVTDGAALIDAADWDTRLELTIELSDFAFTPMAVVLEAGQPYVLKVVNRATVKHEFTTGDFFGTVAFRKAEDASGEFKGPMPREVEVFAGQQIELFLIPTLPGMYRLVCEIEGHLVAGMFGTITVTAAS